MFNKIIILFFLYISFPFAQKDSSLILNEIMFAPFAGSNEFIEVFNLNKTDSIDLMNFKIQYQTSAADDIISAGFGTVLAPNSFAVIFEGDYNFNSGIYDDIIPSNALILKISDNAFGSSGMSNSADRTIKLISGKNDTVDIYTYSADNSSGISDERIYPYKNNAPFNWKNSKLLNGTPGFRNSVTPHNFDLKLSSLTFYPENPIQDFAPTINITIKNIGSSVPGNCSVFIYNDKNLDSLGSSNELIFTESFDHILPEDSIIISRQLTPFKAGTYHIIGEVVFNADENILNNKLFVTLIVLPPANEYNSIVINEIMYTPGKDEPEWIEIFNTSDSPINLNNWKVSDNSSSLIITGNDKFISPDSYLVMCSDSSIINFYKYNLNLLVCKLPSLNNSGDAVVLHDSRNILIDSVNYQPVWGGSSYGISLERRDANIESNDPNNWGSAKTYAKATPGLINSISQKDFDIEITNLSPFPAIPYYEDNILLNVKAVNKGKNDASFYIQLFVDANMDSIVDNELATINNLFLPAGDSAVFQSKIIPDNFNLPLGFYANAVFISDQDSSNNKFYKKIFPAYRNGTIIINEIMPVPADGEPEWIELFNNSNNSVNITMWSVNDIYSVPASAELTTLQVIQPKSYFVITKDSSIKNYHRYIPSQILIVNLPNLNNDADGIVIKDYYGNTIDSVLYDKDWEIKRGHSLERISAASPSELKWNWGASTDIELSTPGRINTLTTKKHDLSVAGIYFDPRFPTAGDDVILSAVIKNNGTLSVSNFNIEFYSSSDTINFNLSLLDSKHAAGINSGDSISVSSSVSLKKLNHKIKTAVRLMYSFDEDTLNNYAEAFVIPGFAGRTCLINEIMYNPSSGKPEWVELINASDNAVNIKDWSISDVFTTPTKNFITNNKVIITPQELFIITKDITAFHNSYPNISCKIFESNFGNLSYNDGLIVYDFRDAIIDSLIYNSSWGGKKGYSIERISLLIATTDSTNWTTCLNKTGSSPGLKNYILDIPSYSKNDIVINEIMYDPDIDNCEFIEFKSLINDSINIGGWHFEDEKKNSYKLYEISCYIPSYGYFILAADTLIKLKYHLKNFTKINFTNSSSMGLSNEGELILLKDVKGNTIDSIWYSKNWHNKNITLTKNISLERINPHLPGNKQYNWSSSVDPAGATPGKSNSIFIENLPVKSNISITPNPFSPDNDGLEDFAIINYNLTQSTAQTRIKIFDSRGRLVRTLTNNMPSGSKGSVVFDGLDDAGRPLRIGIYIVLLEALNANTGIIEILKSVIVVARKL